jgi:hypothetical protein
MSIIPHDVAMTPVTPEPPVLPVHVPSHADAVAPPAATADQVRAADEVFSHQRKESAQVEGLIGLWAGSMILGDMALDSIPTEEEEAVEEEPEGGQPEPVGA